MTKPFPKAELEYRLLYAMVVAGKSATFAADALGRFFDGVTVNPFTHVLFLARLGQLENRLRQARTGNYRKLAIGFEEAASVGLDLRKCTPAELETIHGIGPKTSRFFLLWTRPDAEFAALDTHVLKWLRYLGYEAPKSTPSGARYADLEDTFLTEARARRMTPRELDSAIWDWCSAGNHKDGEWPEKLSKGYPKRDGFFDDCEGGKAAP